MIRINLLRSAGLASSTVISSSSGSGDGGSLGQSAQKIAGAKIAVILACPILLYAYEQSNISSLNEQLTTVTAEATAVEGKKSAYGDTGPKVEKYTKQKEKIESQIVVIRELTKNRLREVKALDALQEITPSPVWYEDIQMKNGLISVKGHSLTEEGLTTLFSSLQDSAIFSRFEPKNQSYQDNAGARVLNFEVEFRVGRQEAP